ncbi:MAG: B12-binding domain-containing radical SAM protein [Deltaproteobacteria bacterium]|nr:B12-binding domain-containing radical SAM protein [Deltaproteobacteria bacterium]
MQILYLINPSNPLVSIINVKASRWNRYRVWKPLGLMVIAALTPKDWKVTIIDENLGVPEYSKLPRPDLVGITAFTSQAERAYALATRFRNDGVPVVIGGIHATMCSNEATLYADAVVKGEAENVWQQVLNDVRSKQLQPIYEGGFAEMANMPQARHDLLANKYAFGSVQTTRGCPLHCSFCSVTAFNGARFRQRPINDVIQELKSLSENLVLIVDDNLIGTSHEHQERAKDLFRAMIAVKLKKSWVAQTTINVANDEELLSLAATAGCKGLFIGFESVQPDTSKEINAKNNLCRCRDLNYAVRRIQNHGILVAGSFIIGFESDRPGIGKLIADTADRYGVDFVNVLFLTPLPGTKLWDEMTSTNQVTFNQFPRDWSYFTLTYPVARFVGLTSRQAVDEMVACSKRFYSTPRMLRRLWRNLWRKQNLAIGFAGGLSYKRNIRLERNKLEAFLLQHGGNMEAFKDRNINDLNNQKLYECES